jgi:hypothetical protein
MRTRRATRVSAWAAFTDRGGTAMAPDEKTPTDGPNIDPVVAEVPAVAAVAYEAERSAFGSMEVAGDANLLNSAVGMLAAKGPVKLKRGVACSIMTEGDVTVTKGGAGLIIGRNVNVDRGGIGVMVGTETTVQRSWIGLLLARKAELSDDSRVLFDWKAALILSAVLLGIFGVVMVVVLLLVRRAMRTAAELRSRLPHLPEMPHLPEWVHALEKLRRSA